VRRSIGGEAKVAARLNAVFADRDIVVTPATAAPPPSAEISRGAGAFRSFNQGSPYVCCTPAWNLVGQPAASVPAGVDADGLPMAVQLAEVAAVREADTVPSRTRSSIDPHPSGRASAGAPSQANF
jgi:Asp-tRNA(Asn)/Glu-tRNA(Gln) amidotransferase A subunit family amidase